MRFPRLVSFGLALLLISPPLLSQQVSPTVQRDPAALAAVQKAVLALGGGAITQLHDASVQGTIQILSASPQPNASFLWEDAWTAGIPAYRREFHQGASTGILVSDNGQPVNSLNGVATKVPSYISFSCAAFHLPAVLLNAELNDTGYSLRYIELTILNGRSAIHIQSFLSTQPVTAAVSAQDWYLDTASGLPLRVEYRVVSANDISTYESASMEFANFQPVSGVLIPFLLTEYGPDGEKNVVTVTSVGLNVGLSPSEFLPPRQP